ncbi:PBECR4 domain-containing protein [Sporosarcina aquimarina]|uniref:PBECR4 domain-containing protein n=1 Tax=Sporosarcina aquimarina TaxID=114975 RepID=A0ABU4FZS5_9BACL|nr:PBECR4 domain-containing protein [Sporosarcina aquimarina]MDW0110219.1 PBECR4 domain-containing protein [Sporosarcina aquimarina]
MMNDNKTIMKLQQGLTAFERVVNKEIHYVYFKEGLYQELVFKPKKANFMHLCGVEYQNPITKQMMKPTQFYAALKSNKVSPKGILKKSFTDQKLQIINCLEDLTKCTVSIIDERTVYLNLSFQKAIRSRKQIFCLSLISTQNEIYVPNSLLNLRSDKGKNIHKGYPVSCMLYL